MQCSAFQTLVDFVDGLTTPEESQTVERHLAEGCARCAATVGWYSSSRDAARMDRSEEPPPWVVGRTLSAIADAREAARTRGVSGFLARIRAVLVADSLMPSPAYSRGVVDARQLLYSAKPFDVDLLVAEAGERDRLRVAGQVLALDDDAFGEVVRLTVELERDGRLAAVAETSAIGEFEFGDVAPGRYDIHILGERRELVLADVPLVLE
jgi:anti-sigma factor RsiW